MTGLIIHPLRIRALDRMKVLRVPFDPQPKYAERPFQVHGDKSGRWYQGNPDYVRHGPMMSFAWKPPYAPGDYFVKETWCCEVDPLTSKTTGKILYKADGQEVMLDDGDGSWAENKDGTFASPWRSPMHMKEEDSRYIVTLGNPVPCRLGEVDVVQQRDEGVIIEIGDEYRRTWDALYPKHPFSPDRWTWGYPMEVRRR